MVKQFKKVIRIIRITFGMWRTLIGEVPAKNGKMELVRVNFKSAFAVALIITKD